MVHVAYNKGKILSASAALAVICFAGTASAQLPIKIAIGNGAPLSAGNGSVGIGILTSQTVGTHTAVRILGTDRTLGVFTDLVRSQSGAPVAVRVDTPLDGVLNSLLK